MPEEEDYTLQLALLEAYIGVPLESNNGVRNVRWWSSCSKLVGGGEHWITLATGEITHTPRDHFISSMGFGSKKTPNPRNWTLISSFQRTIGVKANRTTKILWPPVPLEELINKLQDPTFRMEYMLPKLGKAG